MTWKLKIGKFSLKSSRLREVKLWSIVPFFSPFMCGKSLIICSYVITELVRQPIQDRLEVLEYGGTHYVGPLYYWMTKRGRRKFWEPKLWGSLGKPKRWKKNFKFFFSINFTQIFRICPKMFQFLKYLLHKQIIEMCHSQNLQRPLLVPCPTQCVTVLMKSKLERYRWNDPLTLLCWRKTQKSFCKAFWNKMQKVVFFPKEVQKVFPSVTPPWAEAVKVKLFIFHFY